MRNTIAAVVLTALLAGCAAKVISSSPRTVVIQAGAGRVADAQPLADEECKKYGLIARLSGRPMPGGPPQFIFDCVK